jgi:hypothetical protein
LGFSPKSLPAEVVTLGYLHFREDWPILQSGSPQNTCS